MLECFPGQALFRASLRRLQLRACAKQLLYHKPTYMRLWIFVKVQQIYQHRKTNLKLIFVTGSGP